MIYVRFTPESRHSEGYRKTSAFDLKRTLRQAALDVRKLPFADIRWITGFRRCVYRNPVVSGHISQERPRVGWLVIVVLLGAVGWLLFMNAKFRRRAAADREGG